MGAKNKNENPNEIKQFETVIADDYKDDEEATILFDDSFIEDINKRNERSYREILAAKDDPEKRAAIIAECDRIIDEANEQLKDYEDGYDYGEGDGYGDEFSPQLGEGEFDAGFSSKEEEEMIADDEENSVDTAWITAEENRKFFSLSDEEHEGLLERSRKGAAIAEELFGKKFSEDLTQGQINTVREKLGLPRK